MFYNEGDGDDDSNNDENNDDNIMIITVSARLAACTDRISWNRMNNMKV